MELKVERGKRVFPVSDRSLDVVLALEKYLKKNGVKLHLESPVEGILIADGRAEGIRLKNGKEERADGVIVCTGGLSYPGTGSTGDGYRFAKAAGHHVTKLYPSLVPLRTEEDWCHELMGLSLKNIEITIKNKKGKKVYSDFGEMLFTHFGVSGPVILSASRHIILTIEEGYRLYIDLKPAMDEKKLDARILRDFEKFANKDFANALDALLPQKLIPVIIRLSGIDARKKVNSVTKEERKRLAFLKERADYIIDTSQLLTRELKAEMEKIFMQNQDYKNLFITILSFGFKYGIPTDSDLVFDVRFLPNPYYVEGLRAKTGNDKEIQDYVLQFEEAHVFLNKLEDMLNFLIPNYIAEGKNQLVISIGCTGGKHRSVTLANELYKCLSKRTEYGIKIEHRDIGKDALRGK